MSRSFSNLPYTAALSRRVHEGFDKRFWNCFIALIVAIRTSGFNCLSKYLFHGANAGSNPAGVEIRLPWGKGRRQTHAILSEIQRTAPPNTRVWSSG